VQQNGLLSSFQLPVRMHLNGRFTGGYCAYRGQPSDLMTVCCKKLEPTASCSSLSSKRKLGYFGHIMRRPEKTVIQGYIEGSRPRERSSRIWINDILEATNCTLGQLLHLTENRQSWREMIHSASNHQY